ncbi:MAG: ArsR family transcriptional regulator [Nitrosopumilus sp.]|nr:MAG: ArsR family transcriptional regulator [Nitrosopumilus sp.]
MNIIIITMSTYQNITLSSPTQNKIIISLYDKPKCASDIALDLDIAFPNISTNLKKMKENDIVVHEREGIRKKYKLTKSGNQMYDFLSVHDKQFQSLVEAYKFEKRKSK